MGPPAPGPATLPDWLACRADLAPHAPAVLHGDTCWTFAELDRRATRTARRLAGLGVAPGDRVALLMQNGLDFVELVHALARLGAILVPLNTRLTVPELAYQVDDVGARLLLHDEPNQASATDLREIRPALTLVSTGATPTGRSLADTPAADAPLRDSIDLAAVHCVMYTSGTTGRPKGALLTYGNHWWSAIGSALNLGAHADDRWLAVLPLFHIGGLSIIFRSIIYGVPIVVHESFDAAVANRALDDDGITLVSLVAVMLRRMLDQRDGRPYPPTLRGVLLGGGPAPRDLLEACARLGLPVLQTYGLTETASQVATLAPPDALCKLGSAGKPLLPNEMRIEPLGPDATPNRPDQIGEILVRGPSVSPGYFNAPDATAQTLRDGWLHTGDLGYLDADGYLYVLDRRADLIVSGGENVYPAEVEAVLTAHPAVAEAGVIGVSDPTWGQVVTAAVRLAPGATATADELLAFCRQRLAGYKVPRELRFVDQLPRTAIGKLLRRSLR